jgi:hypothetical protein
MQQINLYQPMFRQQRKIFSAVTMLQISGFFLVVLAAAYGYNLHGLKPFRAELTRTAAEFDRLAQRIESVRAAAPGQAEVKLVEREIARLSQDLESGRRLKQALASGSFGNTTGFSSYFEALARGHVDGAWLTGIAIAQGGGQLSFSGKTIDPELVPLYLRRLGEAPVFHKRGFNLLELARSEEDVQLVTFNISTGG